MKNVIFGLLAIIVAEFLQIWLIGINGLTLFSIPTTIFLGLHIIEKLEEQRIKAEEENKLFK